MPCVVVAAGLLVGACAGGDDTDAAGGGGRAESTTTAGDDPASTATAPPVTAAGAAPAVRVASTIELDRPSAVADPPGPGPVLVSTLAGPVHEVDLATGTSTGIVLDLSERISTGGERGLLGLALDPSGGRLYANLTNPDGDTEVRSWAMGGGQPEGGAGVLHLTLEQPYANHNGGNLAFGPDGALWIGSGDGGSAGDPDERAQDPDDLLGKMLRVVPDPAGGARAAPGNPDWGGRPEVWALGLRNPWRYTFDRATGALWVADVGQGSVEEVTVVDPSAARPNFGWDDVEGDEPFEGAPSERFLDPAVTYGHGDGCSITGGYVYRGAANPGLAGWYLFGDYCGGWVRAVPASDPARSPVELLAEVGPVLSFAQLEDGELLLLTDEGVHQLAAP
jgi:glucose/arabinose dehydrogenase